MNDTPFRANKGLQGVIFDTTEISKAMPEKKALIYRGYPVHELADTCRFEEVQYLLLNGELPNEKQLNDFCQLERSNRAISKELLSVIKSYPKDAHPMDAVRTGVSFLGMEKEFSSVEDSVEKAVKLMAKVPTIIAANERYKAGKEPIAPDENLGFSENFFNMYFGEIPDSKIVKAFDGALTLYAEHGFNASSFTSRVIVSSLSDMCAGVTGAIGSLKGSLHGGANEEVMYMLQSIESPADAKNWLMEKLASKSKIMGFGHRLYRIGDSRVPKMKQYRETLAEITGNSKWVEISKVLEETMIAEKNIYPNLDFPAGPVYYMMGFEINVFTPIFVMARTSGWCSHILEQLTNNRLVRPMSDYVGQTERSVTPISER